MRIEDASGSAAKSIIIKIKNLCGNKVFLVFLLANGFAAIVNFSSRILLSYYFSYVTSIIVAYLFGIVTAYILCRIYVFRPQKNSTLQQILYFVAINGVAILQTLVVSVVLTNYIFAPIILDLSMRETIAHFIGICVPVLTSYWGHKYLTFK